MSFGGFINEFTNAPLQSTFPSYLAINFTSLGLTTVPLEWVFQNQNTLFPFSNTVQVTVNASATNSIVMPIATVSSVGQQITIINSGASTVLIKSFGGTLIATILTTQSWQIQLTDNTTQAGTWISIQNGASTSSATAASLVDPSVDGQSHPNAGGLKAFSTYLKYNPIVYTYSGAGTYTQASGDRANILVWTGGTGIYQCAAAATFGNGYTFNVQNTSTSGVVTITPAGGDTINGSTLPFTLAPGSNCSFVSDGVHTLYSYSFSQTSRTITNLTEVDLATAVANVITLTAQQAAFTIQKFVNTGSSSNTITINYPAGVNAQYIAYNATDGNTFPANIIVQNNGATLSQYKYTIVAGSRLSLFSDTINLYNTPNFIIQTSVSLGNGTAGAPSLNFTTQPTTGIYLNGSNYLAITQGGQTAMTFSTVSNISYYALQVIGSISTSSGGTISQNTISIYSLMRAYG